MNWERYLGPGDWTLKLSSGELICIQSSLNEENETDEQSHAVVAILDAATGRSIQRLQFDSKVDHDDVDLQADRCVVRAGNDLIGFTAWPTTDIANVTDDPQP